jgi:hypothetical protein
MSENSIIAPKMTQLTHRERFRRMMHYQSVDRIVHWEFGYLEETRQRWFREGLPREKDNDWKVESYFGVDPSDWVPLNAGIFPAFEGQAKVLEQREHSRVIQLPDGTIQEEKTEGIKTIPHYLKHSIANREDWNRFKERLNPKTPGRRTVDYREIGQKLRTSDRPVGIWMGSFFGHHRDWAGFEGIAMMCLDDRELVEEMIRTTTDLLVHELSAALSEVEVDFAAGWEDICFRNGPIISPKMFGELVIPQVKRVTSLLRQHGVTVCWTDCDGDITQLVPLWLDAGINCMFPLEVHPGSDPVKYRKMFGKRILLRGGLEKYQLAHTKKEIVEELKRVEHVVNEGGYIPHGDHRIPEDVPLENYQYYTREKLNMLGWKKEEIEQIPGLKLGKVSVAPGAASEKAAAKKPAKGKKK